MMHELIQNWTTAAGGGFKTVTYWDGAGAIATQRAALHQFCMDIRGQLANSVTFFQDNSGRIIDENTGTLLGLWNDATAYGNVGNGGAQCVPDSSQVLMRWNTNVVVAGRFLKGRSFIPGLLQTNVTSGNLGVTSTGVFQTAGNTLIAVAAGLVVWHRPPPGGSGGVFSDVQTCQPWPELAVLRRRRA